MHDIVLIRQRTIRYNHFATNKIIALRSMLLHGVTMYKIFVGSILLRGAKRYIIVL